MTVANKDLQRAVDELYALPPGDFTRARDERAKALVLDATGITESAGLVALQEFFTPLMRRLRTCPRVVVGRASRRLPFEPGW